MKLYVDCEENKYHVNSDKFIIDSCSDIIVFFLYSL